jgi:hypothetical protein
MGLEIMHLLLPNSKENPLNKVMQIIGDQTMVCSTNFIIHSISNSVVGS